MEKVCAYDEDKLEVLRNNPGIIRNRLKIQAAVTNARVFHEIQQEYGSFSEYLWHWTDGKVVYMRSTDIQTAVMKAYPQGNYLVFEGDNHMQFQIRDPEGFAEMLRLVMEENRLPELPFLRERS